MIPAAPDPQDHIRQQAVCPAHRTDSVRAGNKDAAAVRAHDHLMAETFCNRQDLRGSQAFLLPEMPGDAVALNNIQAAGAGRKNPSVLTFADRTEAVGRETVLKGEDKQLPLVITDQTPEPPGRDPDPSQAVPDN